MTLRRIGKIDVHAKVNGNDSLRTGFVFYSYARGSSALEFHFKDQQGKPVDMLGTKVRLLLIVKVEGEEKEFKTLDEEIVTESSLNGIVRYIIPDRLMGYQGIVDGWIYLDFPDGSKTDEVRFRFTMARSKIDEEVPLIQEFYVPQFEEMLESVKTDLNEDVALAKSKINQSVTETQNVAQVEQGKIQEELPKIQTELSTINADIEAQKEKLEAASIYSKAEVDSKVADLDSVKADKTFVDAQLAETESQLEFQANADIPIVIPTYDGNNQTTHPKVLYFETPWNGYKYWMAHTPYANSNDRLENPSLCVSNDGITWAEPNGLVNPLDKPIDTTISHMSDNDLLMRGNVMEIWYRETIRNGGGDIIYRKTSTNGLTWSDREIVFQTGAGGQILSPSTLYEDGKYKMWYVSNFEIHYMESTNGIEWTTPIEVTVNYEKVSENYMPWHLEVIKEDGKYGLVLNAQRSSVGEVNSRRAVFYGKSENKAEFNVEPIIHPRPRGTGTWDDRHIYKSSLVKVNDLYRLYYSAQSDQNQWAVGVSQGKDVFNLSGVNVLSANNDLTNINKIKPFGDYYVDGENGKVYYTGKNINSYLTNDELKFVNPNVAGARLIVEELPNTLEVRGDNRNTRGNFKARNILVDRIVPNATNGEIPVDGNFLIMGSQEERKGLKFVDLGNKAVRIGIGSMNNTAKVYRDGATQYGGFLELAGLIVEGGTTVPEIEGAIRYNDTLKKHQGFDGTTWNNLY